MVPAISSGDVPADKIAASSELKQLLDRDNVPWYRKRNLRLLYFTLVPAALGVEMTSGYDASVLNGLQAVQPWQDYFNYPKGATLGILSAAFSIGAVAAIPFVPCFDGKFGRKASILFGSIIVTIGAIVQATSTNIGMFLAARIVLGAGIPFAINGASQLLSELCYEKERSIITGLFNESWYVGAILAAGTTLGTFSWPNNWAWRLPSLFQLLPSLLQLIFVWFVPESPRWLISKDRHDEALEILIKYHAEGNRDSEFVSVEYRQICDTIALEKESIKSPWKNLVTDPVNRRRLLVAACVGLFSQWSGNGLVSYYLSKVLSSVGINNKRTQNQINLGLMCWNLITGVSGSFLTGILKRRRQYLFSYTGMTIMFASWTAASAIYDQNHSNTHAAGAVVAMIFIYYACYNTMMPLTYIFICEVFPFIHRSKGVAVTQLFTRAGSGFNMFINPMGLEQIGWKFYLVYVAWLAVETTVIYFLYPETKGPSLEEVSRVMEGRQKFGESSEAEVGQQNVSPKDRT